MFILFAVFAVLSVMIIYIGSGVYGGISENKSANEQKRTTLSYIVNKVRDTGGSISIRETDGIPVLALQDNTGDVTVETLIYEYDGRLMEMRIMAGDEFDLKFGSTLLKTDGIVFELDKERKLLSVTVKDSEDGDSSVSVYLGERAG